MTAVKAEEAVERARRARRDGDATVTPFRLWRYANRATTSRRARVDLYGRLLRERGFLPPLEDDGA